MIGRWPGGKLKGHISEVNRCVKRSGYEVDTCPRDRLTIRWTEGMNSCWRELQDEDLYGALTDR